MNIVEKLVLISAAVVALVVLVTRGSLVELFRGRNNTLKPDAKASWEDHVSTLQMSMFPGLDAAAAKATVAEETVWLDADDGLEVLMVTCAHRRQLVVHVDYRADVRGSLRAYWYRELPASALGDELDAMRDILAARCRARTSNRASSDDFIVVT